MQDRPSYDELLAAVERFLERDVMPNSEGARRFHARVAANAVRIVRRELNGEEERLLAEWSGLDGVLGTAERPETLVAQREAIKRRNEELCGRIRDGDADSGPFREAAIAHVRRTVQAKLTVSNPSWIGPEADGKS